MNAIKIDIPYHFETNVTKVTNVAEELYGPEHTPLIVLHGFMQNLTKAWQLMASRALHQSTSNMEWTLKYL